MTDHPATLAGHPLTTSWRVRRQTLFFYEADIDALAKLTPPQLAMREVRPGVGLCAVESLNYPPGHFGETVDSCEIVFAVLVEPDLRIAMPVPRMALSVVSVLSSSARFVEQESILLRMPLHHAPSLTMHYSADATSVDILEGTTPIVECRNTLATPTFTPKLMYGLIYTVKHGELHHGAFRWEGEVSEHQRPGDTGAFHEHAAFHGLPPRSIHRCYSQMAANPAVPPGIGYYHFGRPR